METITVLKVAPRMLPEVVEIGTDLDSLQKAVSIDAPYQGYVELIRAERGVSLMMNEEGKLIPLQPNRAIVNDVICGVFYVVGDTGDGGLSSLPEYKIAKYKRIFNEESFI